MTTVETDRVPATAELGASLESSRAHPSNMHLTVASPFSGLPPLRERVEQKYFVSPERIGLAFALMRRTCRAEALHPVGQVNSLYFDTPDLDQHERSISGEHAKDKVRIRWYGTEWDPHRTHVEKGAGVAGTRITSDGGQAETVEVWLELKSRRGFASTKQRQALDVPAVDLTLPALPRGIVSATVLTRTMAGFGFIARGALRPVVAISYWRYRFVEPETGFRVSIDSRIRSTMVLPGIGRGEQGLCLPGAVVELKGPVFDIPRALHPLANIGTTWTRYSKYSSSLDAHAAVSGSVSRLWPSGMMAPVLGSLTRVDRGGRATPVMPGDRGCAAPERSSFAGGFIDERETE